ncbi:MAG: 4-deoxy-4-formamido-L-arabinose-phosphoundecaprenol deformylase [Verrucomicrobia bacterium]|nr:4-deoxy-4-formamido-L-arabinose-phosphoundecaprenol deformylase [Verrucomicrobiota bacterium]
MKSEAPQLIIKIDVDTDRGTREGVPALVAILKRHSVPATFLFSLGPDNTGKAIRRVFRPGFLKKVTRTRVTQLYGWRTLLSGTLLPAPQIGKRNESVLRAVKADGFAAGIHCYDHFRWQDYLHRLSLEETRAEFGRAVAEFERIFGEHPQAAGAAGWQANASSFQVYDEQQLLYGSDCRGAFPFFPQVNGKTFRTLQIPTTLPTLDELLGRPDFPENSIVAHYLGLLRSELPNVLTIHAEIEGMQKAELFEQLVTAAKQTGVTFTTMEEIAHRVLQNRNAIPACVVEEGTVDGRSGFLASQRIAA